jgi:hypothetical protein
LLHQCTHFDFPMDMHAFSMTHQLIWRWTAH